MNKQPTLTTAAALLAALLAGAVAHAATPAGLSEALTGEDSASVWLSQHLPASTLTRAEIRKALLEPAPAVTVAPSTLTRAEVRAEMLRARDSGRLQAMVGEDSGDAYLARHGHARDVRYAGPNIGKDEEHHVPGRAG